MISPYIRELVTELKNACKLDAKIVLTKKRAENKEKTMT